ncbi:MAG: glycosyltransferase family 4 protein [Magnetococcales bacterium]|nr:glycosyltransferase family 4 protein [Magnetococcales bacterium]
MKPLIVYHLMYENPTGGINAMVETLASSMANGPGAVLFRVGRWNEAEWGSSKHGKNSCYFKRIRMPWDSSRYIRGFFGWLWEFPQTWWQLVRMIRNEKIEVIHLHSLHDHQLVFWLLSRYVGIPCVITLHGSEILKFSQRSDKTKRLNNWLLHKVDGVACVSEQVLQALNHEIPDIKASSIYNGIDIETVQDVSRKPLASSLPSLPANYFVLVGHIFAVKGHDIAVSAWHELVDTRADLHLIIIGQKAGDKEAGEFAREVLSLAKNGKASSNIHFLGIQPQEVLLPIIKDAHALIIPSRSEGLPYVLLEGGALNKPVIASAIPPFINQFNGVEGCYLFTKDDHISLSDIILQVMARPEKLQHSGKELGKFIQRDFSSQKMANNYQKLYFQSANSGST